MIVGPPGSGKTDVAVQIIVNLYRNHPNQKILLVAHSNAALNDLFAKIIMRDVDQRHLLRLGGGEKDLSDHVHSGGSRSAAAAWGEDQFSRQGRVNWSLARRIELLGHVQRLAGSLGVPGDVGYSCETAGFFYAEHVVPRIEAFRRRAAKAGADETSKLFPFSSFFADAVPPVFSGDSSSHVDAAMGCVRHIEKIFDELKDFRCVFLLHNWLPYLTITLLPI